MKHIESSHWADDPDYRLFCEERLTNPYPLYHRLRAEDPVHWSTLLNMWLVTRYEDVLAGLRNPSLSSDRTGMYVQALPDDLRQRVAPLLDHLSNWIQLTDEPVHGRLRRLVNLAFTPKVIAGLRPQIEQLVDELLSAMPQGVPVDFRQNFSYPLPATVICGMLGIPLEQRDTFRDGIERLIRFSNRGGPSLRAYADDANEALEELVGLFEPLIQERRREPGDDLLSALASVESDGERLTTGELYAMCVFIFLAGHETTTAGITSAVFTLLERPDQLARLRQDRDRLLSSAVEEVLRYESPVPRAVRRALTDLTLGGKQIKAGDLVVFLLGAANRDPEQFPEPDLFDIARHPNRHLGFGFGPHFCLGAPLARLEIEIALGELVDRFPHLRLADGPLTWKTLMGNRSLEALSVIAE